MARWTHSKFSTFCLVLLPNLLCSSLKADTFLNPKEKRITQPSTEPKAKTLEPEEFMIPLRGSKAQQGPEQTAEDFPPLRPLKTGHDAPEVTQEEPQTEPESPQQQTSEQQTAAHDEATPQEQDYPKLRGLPAKSLPNKNPLVCLPGYLLHRLEPGGATVCTNGSEFQGPFTQRMIEICKKKIQPGHEASCSNPKWNLRFALWIRSQTESGEMELCPPGARYDLKSGKCLEGIRVVGPFEAHPDSPDYKQDVRSLPILEGPASAPAHRREKPTQVRPARKPAVHKKVRHSAPPQAHSGAGQTRHRSQQTHTAAAPAAPKKEPSAHFPGVSDSLTNPITLQKPPTQQNTAHLKSQNYIETNIGSLFVSDTDTNSALRHLGLSTPNKEAELKRVRCQDITNLRKSALNGSPETTKFLKAQAASRKTCFQSPPCRSKIPSDTTLDLIKKSNDTLINFYIHKNFTDSLGFECR